MPLKEDLEKALAEHEVVLGTVEKFMEAHAKNHDPLLLQAIMGKVLTFTERLSALLAKYPIVP